MTSIETMIRVGEMAYWRGQKERELRRPMRVGELYSKLSDEDRESLKALTSAQAARVRWDVIDWMLEDSRCGN